MQIKILMQNIFFLLPDSTRGKKKTKTNRMQVEVSTFSERKNKKTKRKINNKNKKPKTNQPHGEGSFHTFSNTNIV